MHAYVTSATLEFTDHDKLAITLNGSPVLKRSDFDPFDFEVLSTADGTLPVDLFESPGDNVLAIEDSEVDSGMLGVSYRLSIQRSDGDPIVVWSEPAQVRMLHLAKDDADPEGWSQPDFDDSAWSPAVRGTDLANQSWILPSLPEPAFAGPLGLGALLPHLSHQFNFQASGHARNLFREHFAIPDPPAPVAIRVEPRSAVRGRTVRIKFIPGPDCAARGGFDLQAWLPKGLELAAAMPGFQWNASQRRLSWRFYREDLKTGYAQLPAAAVLEADGWSQPDKALGRAKDDKTRRELNIPYIQYIDAAHFTANRPAWFRLATPTADLAKGKPRILGVIFHAQMMLGGSDTAVLTDADILRFNYSVDGTQHGALAHDAAISHAMSSAGYWFDAYYDASEDRRWTWADLAKLAVKIRAKANGTISTDRMASMVATVKYDDPDGVSPWFDATVTEAGCATLPLKAALLSLGRPAVASDPAVLLANPGLCSPTPTPSPAPAPLQKIRPAAKGHAPSPSPGGLALSGEDYFHLGCLSANPEPFSEEGSYLSFCLGKDAFVVLRIYRNGTDELMRTVRVGSTAAGDRQVFVGALDNQGHALAPGLYLFQLEASQGGHLEQRGAVYQMVKRRNQ